MNVKDYIFIARPDHWPKNIMVFTGSVFAFYLTRIPLDIHAILRVLMALAACCFLASANYAINEWLDSAYDKFHPVKKSRPGASGRLQPQIVILEYLVFAGLGLGIGVWLSSYFLQTSIVFLLMGLVYNVPPVRAKDKAYLDVATESVNNPLRFILGWIAYSHLTLPPSSILLAYWAAGGFLMAVKRYAEYRFIDNPGRASLYRASFNGYTEKNLLLYSIFCAITSLFFLAIFLIKYHIEFIFLFPFIAFLFVWYLDIGMSPLSASRSPEKIFREKKFFRYLIFLVILAVILSVLKIPELSFLLEPIRMGGE